MLVVFFFLMSETATPSRATMPSILVAQPINLWSAAEFTELLPDRQSKFVVPQPITRICGFGNTEDGDRGSVPGLGTGSRHIGIDRSTSLIAPGSREKPFP